MDVGIIKLHLIEELLKVDDEAILTELELVFAKNRLVPYPAKALKTFRVR